MRLVLLAIYWIPILALAQSPKLSFLLPHTSGALSFEFSSNEKLLITTGRYDNAVKVWDVNSGKTLVTLTGEKLNKINTKNKKQFSYDFQPRLQARFIAGSDDVIYYLFGRNTAAIWEASTGNIREINFPDSCRILSLFTVPASGGKPNICISCIGSGNIMVFDFAGKTFKTIRVHRKPIVFTFLSGSLHYIATESADSAIKVINTATWLPEFEYTSSKGIVSVQFSAKEDMIVLSGNDGQNASTIWSLKTKNKVYAPRLTHYAQLSDDENTIYDFLKDSLFVINWRNGAKNGRKISELYPALNPVDDNPFLIAALISTYSRLPSGAKADKIFTFIQNNSSKGARLQYAGIEYMNWSFSKKYFGLVASGALYAFNAADWSLLPFVNKNPFYDDVKVWNYSDGVLQVINTKNYLFSWDIKTNRRKDEFYKYNVPSSLSPLAHSPAATSTYRNRRLTPSINYLTDSSGRYDIYLVDEETIVIADYKTKEVYASLQLSDRSRLESYDYKRSILIFRTETTLGQKTKLCMLEVDAFIREYSGLQITFGWVYEDQAKGIRNDGTSVYLEMDMIVYFFHTISISNVGHSLNHLFTNNFDLLITKPDHHSGLNISKTDDGYIGSYATIETNSEVVSFACSKDDKWLVYSVSQYSGPVIWSMETKQPVITLEMTQLNSPYFLNTEIRDLKFSYDKKYVVGTMLQNQYERTTVVIWNTSTGKPIKVITDVDLDFPYSLSNTANHLVYTTASGATATYSLGDNKNSLLYYNTRQVSNLIEYSDDGRYLISYYNGVNTIFGDAATFRQKLVIDGTDFRFIDAGNIVSYDGSFFNVYNIDTGLRYRFIILDTTSSICFNPANYYSLPKAVAGICYHVSGEKMINLQQLDLRYNRPDRVLEAMGIADTALIASYKRAYEKRLRKLKVDTLELYKADDIPEADFINRNQVAYQQSNARIDLHIKGSCAAGRLHRFNIWINGVPLYGLTGTGIQYANKHTFDTTVSVELSQGDNKIETSLTNANGAESYRSPLYVKYVPAKPAKEKTWLIGIGIDKFARPEYNLEWCTKDIRDLALHLKAKYKSAMEIDTLFNESVTVQNIAALKQKLRNTSVNDKVIVAYSGHGLLSENYDYYLSTYNINFHAPAQDGLLYDELENLLDSIPARKKLMLIDACHSGEIDKEEMQELADVSAKLNDVKGIILSYKDSGKIGMKNSFQLMQELFVNIGYNTGATIISAAAGTQFALESNNLQNGVFTYSILEYMQQHEHANLSALKKYVNARVSGLTQGLQEPTSRSETIDIDWDVW